MIRKMFRPLYFRMIVIAILYSEYKYLIKNLGSFFMLETQEKQRASIIVQAHVIEKGLSLKNTRAGFGVPKIINLLDSLEVYYKKYKDQELLEFTLTIIDAYVMFNKTVNVENAEIIERYNNLQGMISGNYKYDHLHGGVINTTRTEIQEAAKIPYLDFVSSRHSIRNFTGESVDCELLKKALTMAEYTPSACNRQPWGNYVFTKKENIIKILDIQTGARQFKNDIGALIIVTSSAASFSRNEYHQLYVNGGMYAMNLLLALHSLGLGTIPLNLGVSAEKIKELKNYCDIDSSEIPVLLIAVGVISDSLNVASSKRFAYTRYSKFD